MSTGLMVSSRVRPSWEFQVSSIIWRILPAGTEYVIGEIRDGGKKTVSFFAVGLDDGRPRWEGNPAPEKWWTGIESVHGNILVLHEYPVPSMPDHRKIFAVDLPTGELLWTNEELAFSFALGDTFYASKDYFDRRAFYGLDAATGRVGEEVPAERIQELMTRRPAGWEGHIGIPLPDDTVSAAATGRLGRTATLFPGESLRYGGVEVACCYETVGSPDTAPPLREHLFVVDAGSGEFLFHDVVCDQLSGPVPGTFFRMGDSILYVKNRSTLRSLAIS
jgi:hypothetical protein